MCDVVSNSYPSALEPVQGLKTVDLNDFLNMARHVVSLPELRTCHVPFVGYGNTKRGDRILMAVDSHYDPAVVDALSIALREKGAKVDLLTLDAGPDREFDFHDEVRVVMRRCPWTKDPRRWEGIPWVEDLARDAGYDLLIHGKGGPTPDASYRYVQVPWMSREHFTPGVVLYPQDVLALANKKTWDMIWKKGRMGRVRITDPEGTDLSYTLFEEYFDGTHPGWIPDPVRLYGHLMGHPTPPFIPQEDATGIAAGTTSHYTRAFSRVKLYLDSGRIERLEGGEQYGKEWGEFLEETRNIQYPCFPRPGLFWLWEVAIGTHPKIVRPQNIHMLSSGGFEWERRRSGVIHLGFGTQWRSSAEVWAGERGITYGHLHVHLLFPTYTLTTRDGEVLTLIDKGRLTALDDPEVRELAARYGDPDEMLREDWIPSMPGISAPGDYDEYARDPARWIYRLVSGEKRFS